jgi:hypothetical protein
MIRLAIIIFVSLLKLCHRIHNTVFGQDCLALRLLAIAWQNLRDRTLPAPNSCERMERIDTPEPHSPG